MLHAAMSCCFVSRRDRAWSPCAGGGTVRMGESVREGTESGCSRSCCGRVRVDVSGTEVRRYGGTEGRYGRHGGSALHAEVPNGSGARCNGDESRMCRATYGGGLAAKGIRSSPHAATPDAA